MTCKFLDHAESEDGLFDGVMEDMEPDQARVQVAVGGNVSFIRLRFRHSITNVVSISVGIGVCQMPVVETRVEADGSRKNACPMRRFGAISLASPNGWCQAVQTIIAEL